MKFKYKVVKKNNEIFEGILDGSDKFEIARSIRESGETPISIEEIKEKNNFFILKLGSIFSRISLREKIMFTRNLSGMLQAGLPLTRALTILEKQTENKAFKNILGKLIDDISKGTTLSLGMSKFPKVFSGLFVPIINAGEESGSLPASLSEIGINLQKSYSLNKKIKGAMMYPSIIFLAMILIGILMLIYVVPTLTKTFTGIGATLPRSTQFIIWLSSSISNHFIIFLLIIIGFISFVFLLSQFKLINRYFDFIVLRLPVIGTIVCETNSARTARTLASLLFSGVDISKALSITRETLQNSYYKKLIDQSILDIEKGQPLSSIFKSHTELYPIMVGEMMEVGEETGNLSSMLVDIANFYEVEVDNKTKDLSTIIEPVLMIFIGAAVGFFAVSMLTPMYSVLNNIK